MQDNDPKYTVRSVKKWFSDRKIDVMCWSSQSLDLNPIENMWSIVKKSISPFKSLNKEKLWTNVQEAWYVIPVGTCQALGDYIANRV